MIKYTTDSPVFSNEINLVERSDLVNAKNHNDSLITLQQNDLALKQSIREEVGFKSSTTTITNDSLITTIFNDGSKATTEIIEGDDEKDTIIRKLYDTRGQLMHTYKTEIDGEVISKTEETEVEQNE